MLQHLKVVNFKLIQDLELQFSDGFNVITGETGAGKSMLLGAISLIMGERANKALIKSENKTIVEAQWKISTEIEPWFIENNLDFETTTIVRREISPSGKSRLFVNDTPVLVNTIKEFTDLVLDVHGQFDNSNYFESKQQMAVLDAYAGIQKESEAFKKKYGEFLSKQKQIDELKEKIQTLSLEKEFDEFVLNELYEADLKETESIEDLEQELLECEKWADYQSFYNALSHALSSENSLKDQLSVWHKQADKLLSSTDDIRMILFNISEELNDVDRLVSNKLAAAEVDEERINFLQTRINQLNKLLFKHKVSTVQELKLKKQDLEGKNHNQILFAENLEILEKEQVSLSTELHSKAKILSQKRNAAKNLFTEEVGSILTNLSMPNAALEVNLGDKNLYENGTDSIEWRVRTVKGAAFEPIKKVASGGEMSRILLAIKCVLADKLALPTLILDEADTGLSGQVALEIGDLLKKMGRNIQIIGISHLPQVAAKAQHHIKMYKTESENTELSNAKVLTENERLSEISEMLSGKSAGPEAINNARILLS